MKLYIFIGLAMIAVCSGHVIVVRDAPAATDELFPMENFLEKVQTGLKDLEKLALDAAGAENTDELKQRASEHIDVISRQFSLFTENIKQETEKLKENDMVKQLRETVDKHIGDFKEHADQRVAKFKEEHPDTYNQVAGHIDSLKQASSAIAGKIDNLAHSEDAQHLKEVSLKFIDEVKDTVMGLANELKTDGGKKD